MEITHELLHPNVHLPMQLLYGLVEGFPRKARTEVLEIDPVFYLMLEFAYSGRCFQLLPAASFIEVVYLLFEHFLQGSRSIGDRFTAAF
uniref:Uncharacterized protein n=1 Tax=Anopheles atroparvus TaxID=41427 RepID=A0AAG5DJT1_ANOAO